MCVCVCVCVCVGAGGWEGCVGVDNAVCGDLIVHVETQHTILHCFVGHCLLPLMLVH